MKAVSLWQPWASLVAFEEKRWETRGRRMFGKLIGENIAIASTKKSPEETGWDDDDLRIFSDACLRMVAETNYRTADECFPDGCVLCIVRVLEELPVELVRNGLDAQELTFGNYSDGRFATRLELVHRFDRPIPCKGSQGLWEWTPPLNKEERENIEHAVTRGVKGSFLTEDGDPLWEGLVAKGYAYHRGAINGGRDRYYTPTEAGIAALRQEAQHA